MRVSVVVPTYRRPDHLASCLESLRAQTHSPDEILVGVRADDRQTGEFLSRHREVTPVVVAEPGVIASMNAAVARSTGDIVCLFDDDAKPLPGWIGQAVAHFAANPGLGAVGGRDLLQDHPEMRRGERTTRAVGRIRWFGKILGNHHRGHGDPQEVHILKGCNCAFRGPLLREIGFDPSLRGAGAQVHWELALGLDLAHRGYRLLYDPSIQAIHAIAARADHDSLHRGGFHAGALADIVFNEHFVIHGRAATVRRLAHRCYAALVGTQIAPGIAQVVRQRLSGDREVGMRWKITRRAAAEGRRIGRESRRDPAATPR